MSLFSSIKLRKPKRSNFDLSHEVKLTTDFGRLTPFLCQEVLPGDTFKCNASIFARMAPMIAPIMSRVDIYTHFFFVPNRLIWDKWEDFITGGEDGKSFPLPPTITLDQLISHHLTGSSQLPDYLGVPPFHHGPAHDGFQISALPFRAYAKIWNDWYRDQNIMPEADIQKGLSGPMEISGDGELYKVRYRCWQKDYFTSALPWPQRGEDVVLPMRNATLQGGSSGATLLYDSKGNLFSETDIENLYGLDQPPEGVVLTGITKRNNKRVRVNLLNTNAEVNLKNAAPTINELRRSYRVQEWLEANARGGARYIEQILSHFGVRSSDARLDRVELLGGGKAPIMISEVLQTSMTTSGSGGSSGDMGSALGDMAGHGVTSSNSHTFKKFFEEHGFVFGIMSIMPKASYMNGLSRMWRRMDKFDYAWPEFANIGEQAIHNYEINMDARGNGTGNDAIDGTFGYAPRYSEYKYQPSRVCGDFRTSLKFWHLARDFGDVVPGLNYQFLTCGDNTNEDLSRIFAVDNDGGDHFFIQAFINLKAKRPLPYYGIPTI